jgi:hypothetical protein
LSRVPEGRLTPGETGRLTDGRTVTSTSTGGYSTQHCHRTERSNDVRCVLCVTTILLTTKELQQKTYPSLRPKLYLPPAPLQRTLHTSPGITYAQIAKQNTPATSPSTQDPQPPQPLPQTSDMQDLKDMLKQLFQQMGTMINLPTTVLTKLK